MRAHRSRDEDMLWLACAVMLLCVWVLIGAVAAGRAELDRRHRLDLAASTARGFSEYVALHLAMSDRILREARDAYLQTGTIPPQRELTLGMAPMAPILLQLSVADAHGRMVASSLPLPPGVSIADRRHFLEFLHDPRDHLYVSEPVMGRVSRRMALQLVRPLLGAAGEFRGVMVASIDPLKLQEYFGALAALDDEGTVVIAGRTDGVVRVRFSRDGISWGQSLMGSQHWREFSQSGSGSFEVQGVIDPTHQRRLVGFHQVANYPLAVAVTSTSVQWPVTGMALSVVIAIAFSIMHIIYTRARVRRLREQQSLIEQLTQSRQREAEASRMKSRFIASVSHELRTPLNAILGFSELLRDVPEHPDNARRADLIHGSGQHLLALLNTLLDLAKIEAGRMEVARVQVDLLATVRTLAEVHQAGAARKGLALTFASGLAPSVTVLADTDATKFQQVLNNVVSNAVKFTSTGTVRVSVALDQQTFVVRVEDTGRGIGPEQLARIFDRFSTASTPGTAREQGTGLGLSLSRELVRLLGGSIHIASRPDEGTQVTIRLPGAPGGATSMILATTPGLVAVVDDVEGNRLLAQAYLERLGWRVRLHADAQSALDMTTSELPEAMLVDVRMPGMSGDQLASLLRAQPATARIRLVGYTAHALPDEIASLRASGFDDVLIKPVLMADMARALPRPAGG